jgi:hypothetical protein
MDSKNRFEQNTETGLLDVFDGKKLILRVERRQSDENYAVEARPSGIQTVGANACRKEVSARTTYLTATRKLLPSQLTDLGFDADTVQRCAQLLESFDAKRKQDKTQMMTH